jgi:hypothetical protein
VPKDRASQGVQQASGQAPIQQAEAALSRHQEVAGVRIGAEKRGGLAREQRLGDESLGGGVGECPARNSLGQSASGELVPFEPFHRR